MKHLIVSIFIILFCITQSANAQDTIPSSKDRIVGRWVETKRIDGDSIKEILEYPDTYIFKDNMIFHKGEASEGVILFNVAGRYTVEEDTVTIHYRDYARPNASQQKAKKMVMQILSHQENEMTVLVKDYDYEYKMVLGR